MTIARKHLKRNQSSSSGSELSTGRNKGIRKKKPSTQWRKLALEGTRYYQSKLDPSIPHRNNVDDLLRGVVLHLTARALKKEITENDKKQNDHEKQVAGDNEKKKQDDHKKQDESDEYPWRRQIYMEYLDQSSRSRFEGLISGISLALPSNDPIITSRRHCQQNVEVADRPSFTPSIQMQPSVSSVSSTSSPVILSSIEDAVRRRPPTHLVQFYSYPQIRASVLANHLELYFKACCSTSSTFTKNEVQIRAAAIVRSFCATVSSCVASVQPILLKLLQAVTMEILCVEKSALCFNELQTMMKRVVSEYEHKVSFASLAFLSSPQDSAEHVLQPLVTSYLAYLIKERSRLVEACAVEKWLSLLLAQKLRNIFKEMEFQSIGHLLEVCYGLQYELTHIDIPPQSIKSDEDSEAGDESSTCSSMKQAIVDLQREVLLVNGQVLPPITSRQQLLELLTSTLNHTATQDFVLRPEADTLIETEHSDDNRKQSSFDSNTLDGLTRRLLLATSRTGSAGDAFFIVRDLFGGDEVEVVSSSSTGRHRSQNSSIELKGSLSSVTIRCHASFDVYPKDSVGRCQPLIQLHTTTTEVIYLQEIRSPNNEEYVLQEKGTDNRGYKSLAIRPALYERVEEWNTPS